VNRQIAKALRINAQQVSQKALRWANNLEPAGRGHD